uniref:Uncharacterized protein n=1 Tax=Anguilla anguilla TaxID=7936 RepID=A0A0E9UF18_ANGAN
MEKLGGTGREE